jgi:hypothetical protein
VFVNTAKVTKPNVMASNGVIHVVNRVLIPPAGSPSPADAPPRQKRGVRRGGD